MNVRRTRFLCSIALLGPLVSACTVVKPVVCTFTTPVRFVTDAIASHDLDDPADAADAEAESLPNACLCVAAPVVIPIRIVERMVTGFIGGFCTGVVSDLNVLVGHTEHATKNLTIAWRTNATTPSESD